mgnify:CR=1 FL=1
MTSKELCEQLNSNLENGLSENQVKQHLEKYGQNKLRQKKEIFLLNFYSSLRMS